MRVNVPASLGNFYFHNAHGKNWDIFEILLPTLECVGVQVWNNGFFSLKKHVKVGRMIKSALFKLCSIACYTFFPSFGQFVNTKPVKTFPFYCEPFFEPFFHNFIRTKTLLSKWALSFCQSDLILRSMWMVPLDLIIISNAWDSQNHSL